MNSIIYFFEGNLTLSIIFVTLLLLVVAYVAIKFLLGHGSLQKEGTTSFDLWYIIMSSCLLFIVAIFCGYFLNLN
ncbi:hypothetical protein [Bacillus cereus group sp. BceL293]|uniref:hypothetical protein n=1 Tax=Bacillus cereus group sp. BceL293 TaxID=3444992 RepID=UPI003F202941